MNKSTFLLSVFSSLIFFCCADHPYESQIVGSWKTIDWTIEGTGQKVDQQMNFVFRENKRYSVDYGKVMEEGNYRITETTLYTREDELSEKSVKIMSFTPDTMVFQMNRAGQLELVTIVRTE